MDAFQRGERRQEVALLDRPGASTTCKRSCGRASDQSSVPAAGSAAVQHNDVHGEIGILLT